MTTPPPQYPVTPGPPDDVAGAPPYAGGYSVQPPRNGMALTGLVLGIISVPLFFLNVLDAIIAILAITFSAIGLARARRVPQGRTGMAVAGLVLGVLGLVAAVVALIVATSIVGRCEVKLGHTPSSSELRQCVRDGV